MTAPTQAVKIQAVAFIHAPVETVFRYVTDLNNLPHWVGPVNSINGVAGRAKVGAQVSLTAHLVGKSVDTTLQVTKLQENESFGYSFPEDTYGEGFDFAFERISAGQTKVLMTYQMDDNNIFSGDEGAITRNLQASLDALRENVEA